MPQVESVSAAKSAAAGVEPRPGLFRRMRERLRGRPDSEHEISLNRVVMIPLVFVYWLTASLLGSASAGDSIAKVAPAFAMYAVAGVGLFAHLLMHPGVSHVRRAIAIPIDLVFLSYGVHLGNDATALLYPIYLWAILGNGFRYGIKYLAGAVLVAILCFGAVILHTPFWQTHIDMGIGLTLGLIAIPAYAATLIRKLSAAKFAAEEASRAKTMFLASVSHELRTPLNAIVGLSDLLTESRLNEDQAEMVRTIGRSGRSLSSLINSILDVSRMEIGKLPAKMEQVDIFAFLADIRDMLAVQASAKGIRISLHVAPDTPGSVHINLGHLEEILVNLGGNAVKFTSDGYVVISVAVAPGQGEKRRLLFTVRDTGIGIAQEARERIFERFSQADETIIDRYGGTGLGLSIVKQLVEGGGGKIGVDSTLGVGSTFWFEMNCKIVEESPPQQIAYPLFVLSAHRRLQESFQAVFPQAQSFDLVEDAIARMESTVSTSEPKPIVVLDEQVLGPEFEAAVEWFSNRATTGQWPLVLLGDSSELLSDPQTLSRFSTSLRRGASLDDIRAAINVARRVCVRESQAVATTNLDAMALDILVAEDNRTNQLVIRKILENRGHRVTIAEDGQQALEALGRNTFDLVLMDVNMPVLNGVETAKLARFIEMERERAPIIALTADATEETRIRCLEAGMDDCLTKPINKTRLVALLEKIQLAKGAAGATRSIDDQSDIPLEPEAANAIGVEAINYRTLKDLEDLGGRDFVDQIVGQFVDDAACVLKELSQAVAQGDAHAFREQAHALRSCAANVGARTVYDLCLEWRAIDASEVAIRGEAHMRQLETEFQRARSALAQR